MRSVSVAALCAAMVSACLGPKEGRRIASDVESDVGDDATATTTTPADTLSGTDITPPDCSVTGCDDGDPCTIDSCDPGTGLCSYAGIPARDVPACTPELCNDGDPCTIDSCAIASDGCRPTLFCGHTPVPGCGGTQCQLDGEGPCDDGNPCTTDRCSSTEGCVHTPSGDPDCVPSCAEAGAVQLHELSGVAPYTPARLVSRVQVVDTSCSDIAEPCNCSGVPALGCLAPPEYIEGACATPLPVSWVAGEASCDICGSSAWCEPVFDTVDYVVWGSTSVNGGGKAVPIIPQQTTSFEVDDFCLRTDLVSLVGVYEGLLTIDGEELHFAGDMEVDEPGWNFLYVREASCENCPNWGNILSEGVMLVFDPHDGWIELKSFADGDGLGPFPYVSGNLYSHRNTLAGRVVLGDGDESMPARLALTRLAHPGLQPSNVDAAHPVNP